MFSSFKERKKSHLHKWGHLRFIQLMCALHWLQWLHSLNHVSYFTVSTLFWKLQPYSVRFTFVAFSRFLFSVEESAVAKPKGRRGRHLPLYFRVLAVCALCCGLFGRVKQTRRLKRQGKEKTSMSRSDADMTRALPDGFFIPLLFSRSFAICDVKKPNLIVSRGRCQSSQTAVITTFFFSLTSIKKDISRIL